MACTSSVTEHTPPRRNLQIKPDTSYKKKRKKKQQKHNRKQHLASPLLLPEKTLCTNLGENEQGLQWGIMIGNTANKVLPEDSMASTEMKWDWHRLQGFGHGYANLRTSCNCEAHVLPFAAKQSQISDSGF